MLVDSTGTFSQEKIDFLKGLWEKFIFQLSNTDDPKKIISFMNKAWIINIDDSQHIVYIGCPNEFVAIQIKKFFQKKLNTIASDIFSTNYKTQIVIYENFSAPKHPLHIDIKKLLKTDEDSKLSYDEETNSLRPSTNSFWNPLDPKYNFDNFVVGWNNEFAYSAAWSIAQTPWKVSNPLFVYGWVGLGKTHLIQAVWNYVKTHLNKNVCYLPSTKLIDEIVEAVRSNKLKSLSSKFDAVDVLIIDDIQFLAEKEKTQEIFHNIFNDLSWKWKQIILSSDRPPRELTLLESRLRSRFSLGLIVDIKKPDFETRAAIAKMKVKEKWETLEYSQIEIIAKYAVDSIREIEWIINILFTKKAFTGHLTDEDVYSSLKTIWINLENPFKNSYVSHDSAKFDNIVEFVAGYYNISASDILGESRKKEVSNARQMLMYLAKKSMKWTLEKIWEKFGWKNHSSVIYAINNFEKTLRHDTKISNDYSIVLEEFR